MNTFKKCKFIFLKMHIVFNKHNYQFDFAKLTKELRSSWHQSWKQVPKGKNRGNVRTHKKSFLLLLLIGFCLINGLYSENMLNIIHDRSDLCLITKRVREHLDFQLLQYRSYIPNRTMPYRSQLQSFAIRFQYHPHTVPIPPPYHSV